MVLFFIFIGIAFLFLILSLFLFIFNYQLPNLKFCNEEYDVNEVTFKPRNLLEDMVEDADKSNQ